MTRPSPAPPRVRLRREAPLLAGLVVGWAFLLHPGFPRFGRPQGADWDTWLWSAAHLWLDPLAFRYNDWRPPAWPALVGLLGSLGSYVAAAQVLALAGVLATVAGAALLARSLAGPRTAGVAAIVTAWLPVVVDGAWWTTPYPVTAGLLGMALGLGASVVRWPGAGRAAVAGVLGGAAGAMDYRLLVLAAAIPLLAALSPVALRRRLLLVALAAGGLLLSAGADPLLRARWDLHLMPLEQQVLLQHMSRRGRNAPPGTATVTDLPGCRDLRPDPVTPQALLGDCAGERRALNLANLQAGRSLPATGILLGALLLALLPARPRPRRTAATAALVFVPAVASTAVAVSWVPYMDRYLLPQAALLGALLPVALSRLWVHVPHPAGRAAVATAGAATLLAWPGPRPQDLWDPLDHVSRRGGEVPVRHDVRVALARWAATVDEGDLVLDCAELHLEPWLLPRRIPLHHAPPHAPWCRQAVRNPPETAGTTWLLTVHPRSGPGGSALPLSAQAVADLGWEAVPLDLAVPEGTLAHELARNIHRWRRTRLGSPASSRSPFPEGGIP